MSQTKFMLIFSVSEFFSSNLSSRPNYVKENQGLLKFHIVTESRNIVFSGVGFLYNVIQGSRLNEKCGGSQECLRRSAAQNHYCTSAPSVKQSRNNFITTKRTGKKATTYSKISS